MALENADIEILLPILKKIPLFSGLNEQLHRDIIQKIILMYYPVNYKIIREKEEGDALYIVKRGSVEVYHEPKEEGYPSKKIAEIYDGGFFGEMSLVSDNPHNASVKAITESEVFILKKEDFKALMNTNTPLAEQISATMVVRLNENDRNN